MQLKVQGRFALKQMSENSENLADFEWSLDITNQITKLISFTNY